MSPEHVCSYRLQLTPDFGFDEAAAIAGYLARLGVSHVYLSPIAQAAPGSTHGYDVCDPTTPSTDLGGPQAYERLCAALAAEGLGQILDIVPNHMAVAPPENRWLDDVLRNGPDSPYASYFDLSWNEPQNDLPYVELPFLGTDYATALANGDIYLVNADDGPRIAYSDLLLPLRPGTEPADLDLAPATLDDLLQRQHYRLVDWHTANQRLSYRRFFDVASLIGLRAEDEATFNASHALPLELIRTGRADGLRIDHVDGLRDPGGYLHRLRDHAPQARIVVEKILGPHETLPDWPVDGTTGYDFLNLLNGLFVDPAGKPALSSIYADFTGLDAGYEVVLDESKRKVMQRLFGAELSRLTQLLGNVAGPEWSLEECQDALIELLVAFPVYRTYLQPGTQPSNVDVEVIEAAVKRAAAHLDPGLHLLLETLRKVLLLRRKDDDASELALRFQQLSGPIMAKGAEDTAFYDFNRLVSLNEVGGDPSRFGVSVDEFHAFCAKTARRWPLTMLATATHDTKRGEDTRLRIDALSRIPEDWSAAVHRWATLNEAFRRDGLPDRDAEYLFYQTLVGAWPLSPDRVWQYMLKAVHEAKIYTSWRQPDAAYEAALQRFVEGALANAPFVADLESFVVRVVELATPATLAQTLLKLTAPGIPDVYQGCELLDLNLVDPDNRRPVDYALCREKLQTAERFETAADVLSQHDLGLTKLWLTQRVLQTRRQHPEAFHGDYVPLQSDDDSLVAFMRGGEVISLAQTRAEPSGRRLKLPDGSWRNVLTNVTLSGGDTPVRHVLGDLSVALLVRELSS